MSVPDIQIVVHPNNDLGEVPVWDATRGSLWWIDVYRCELHNWEAETSHHRRYPLPGLSAGGEALRSDGGVLVALDTGLFAVDPGSGEAKLVHELLTQEIRQTHRPNDVRCDRAGRLWYGSMNRSIREPSGGLHSLDPHGRSRRWLNDVVTPNGLCFSPDGGTLYFCDSRRKLIWAFDCDPASGEITNRRVFCDQTDLPGIPDGSTVDAEGFLWNAVFRGNCLVRYDPDGRLERTIPMPVTQPTSVAFGGSDLRTLFVTTAAAKLEAERLALEPMAGALLALEPGPAGLPEPNFRG